LFQFGLMNGILEGEYTVKFVLLDIVVTTSVVPLTKGGRGGCSIRRKRLKSLLQSTSAEGLGRNMHYLQTYRLRYFCHLTR